VEAETLFANSWEPDRRLGILARPSNVDHNALSVAGMDDGLASS
jgi:hypothetical protein